jgi:hypothetical protein
LAVNLGGWLGWLSSRDLYLQFAHLRHLSLFDRGECREKVSFKVQEIEKVLNKAQKANKNKGKKRYVTPKIRTEEIPRRVEWRGSVDE